MDSLQSNRSSTRGIILSGHDRSDGGLITTLLEMAFSGNCGLNLALNGADFYPGDALLRGAGPGDRVPMEPSCPGEGTFRALPDPLLGSWDPVRLNRAVTIQFNGELVLDDSMVLLRQWWEETSYQLERLQMNPECADAEKVNCMDRKGPEYSLSFTPEAHGPSYFDQSRQAESDYSS